MQAHRLIVKGLTTMGEMTKYGIGILKWTHWSRVLFLEGLCPYNRQIVLC